MSSEGLPGEWKRPEVDMADVLAQQPVIYVNLPQSSERAALLMRLVTSLAKGQKSSGQICQ